MLEDSGVIVAITGQIVTWLGVIILFAIAWGRMVARVEHVENDVSEMKDEMRDPDHRILTEDKHREICESKQEVVGLKLEHICKKLDSRNAIDADVFERLRGIESSITEIKTELKIKGK